MSLLDRLRPGPRGEGPRATLHVDGASRGNGGPSAAGIVLEVEEGTLVERGVVLGHGTSNQAEYRALLLGLEEAARRGARSVRVRMDSELVVRQVQGRYAVRHPGLVPLHQEALRRLAGFAAWDIAHVPRARNARADAMANRALDEGRDVQGPG